MPMYGGTRMDMSGILSGNLMTVVIVVGLGYIIYQWIGGNMKQPLWKLFTIVPLPNEARSEVFKSMADEIRTIGKPAQGAHLVYDGWTIGKITNVLKKTIKEGNTQKTVYSFVVEQGGGLLGSRRIIVHANEDNVMVGDKVYILKSAPTPIARDVYITDMMSGSAITREAVSSLMGDLVAAMRMALPEMYVWANPATAAVLKEMQEQAAVEQEAFAQKIKDIT